MALVAYSDSEGSDDEHPKVQQKLAATASKPTSTTHTNFAAHKTNPRKIQVKLQDVPTNGGTNDEPAPKRQRTGGGGGAFSGFNSMLPPPKRDADAKAVPKPAARKVFSLKTGAEPGFSRQSDAELKELFSEQEQHSENSEVDDTIPPVSRSTVLMTTDATIEKPIQGNPFMFKPLSVARGNKKSKSKATRSVIPTEKSAPASLTSNVTDSTAARSAEMAPPPKKVSLFSMNGDSELPVQPQLQDEEDEIIEILDEPYGDSGNPASSESFTTLSSADQAQSLDSIASDLKLSKADRRQLFGRRGQGGTAVNVVNFNTDQEYAANEELRATGEQIQYNPVRSIAPGKHSLKQLVSAATGQKDALEESFASGKRNKKEAGNKYGW